MWICSQHGFYSIVRKDKGRREWQVRARRSRDLINLLESSGVDAQIIRTDAADYRWRIVVLRPQLARIMAALLRSIDYPNFKSRIHERQDQCDKGSAYGQFWASMHHLQQRED